MANGDFFDDTFDRTVKAAVAQAREETLAAGVPIFYRDSATGLEVMEQPGGRKFEIRYVAGAPREELGNVCMRYMDDNMQNLPCQRIQVDEIWQFVGAKERAVRYCLC
jgi:hypothetical protein